MDKFVSMTVRDDSGNECSFGYNGSDDKIAAKVTALLSVPGNVSVTVLEYQNNTPAWPSKTYTSQP